MWGEGQEFLGDAATICCARASGQRRAYPMRSSTPDNTLVFRHPDGEGEIRKDQKDCMGCLSHCGFSSWKDHDDYTTGRLADPRSFCIQKTLQDIAHGGRSTRT
jgi:hypothetical protein